MAQGLQPEAGSLFAAPAGSLGWLALVCGAAGIWLVPGLWLSAVMIRTGHGLTAWLGCRIGTTLAWYALMGPVVHLAGEGARVTTAAILIPTVAASVAVAIGVALGISRRPTRRWQRFLVAATVGAICAQVVIWVWMRLWDFGMNYSHIRRLDWLIVLVCALLGTAGALCRPTLPRVFATRNARTILLVVLTLGATTAAVLGVGAVWSPAQRMPSAVSVEQIPAPSDADVAFAVTAIGPEGNQLVRRSDFTASDEMGRTVPVSTRLEFGRSAGDQATLLVTLDDVSKPVLCGTGAEAKKLTVRDRSSGVLVQAVIPEGWCAR